MQTTTMTITVPANPGELAYFTVEFEKSKFDDAVWYAELLVKPSDVYLAEEMGAWKVVE